jgi:tripartite-type tricarboxylate transporter receptor subunit TctC
MRLTRRTLAPLALAALPARAQTTAWPDRPVRVIVPYGPGGANDILARLVGQKLSERLGQPIVVENRPGAQAALGTTMVARAPPDGYTLLVAASGPITVSPATNARLAYHPLRDLAPVSQLAAFPLILLVGADAPFGDLAGLIAYAKANPERANYAAPSASFQLANELFKQRTGTAFVHVAYRGSVDTVNAVVSGDVTMALVDSGPATPALQAGRVRGLAVTAARRLASFPRIPSMAEAGLPDMELAFWTGMLAPAGTPAPIVARLHEESVRALAQPDVRERLASLAVDPVGSTPEAFRRLIGEEIELWASVARTANIRFED